jgi:predicted transcriptional regulator
MYHRQDVAIGQDVALSMDEGDIYTMQGDSGGSFGVAVQSDETGWSCKAK